MSLWSALGVGRSALQASQLALEIASHNIANAGAEGYARQRVHLAANPARWEGPTLLAGTGVHPAAVEAVVNEQLEANLRTATSDSGDLDIRRTYLSRLEAMFNELSDEDLSTALSEFFNALEDLEPSPGDIALRGVVVERGLALVRAFNRLRDRLDRTRQEVDQRIVAAVGEVNRLVDEVADLNRQIVEREAGGARANDLRDQRNRCLNDLARIVNIRTIETPTGAVNVLLGNHILVQDRRSVHLQLGVRDDRGVQVSTITFADDGAEPDIVSGQLAGLVASRDEVAGGLVDDLDALARALIGQFNRIHSVGQGLTPFSTMTASNPVTDPSLPLNEAGLPFHCQNGRLSVTVVERGTGIRHTSAVDIDLDGLDSDTTLADLVSALDGIEGISARVDSRNRLVIEAEGPEWGFVFSSDTSGVLAALGVNGFFTGSDSRTIGVRQDLASDPSRLAVERADGTGSNVPSLLAVRWQPMSDLDGLTLGDYLETSITALGTQTASANDAATAAESFLNLLRAEREALSGVSIDEEVLDIIRYQHTFQAAARVVATVDELLRMLMQI